MANKLIVITAVLVVVTGIASLESSRGILVNTIVDGILKKIREKITTDGLDPMSLPPYEIKLLGLGFIGKLELNECTFYNLSTIYRSDDVQSQQANKTIYIQTSLGFDNLQITCAYKLSLLNLGLKHGKLVINIPQLRGDISMDYNLKAQAAQLNDLKLKNRGLIDVHLEGIIIDALLSIITEAVGNLFKNIILKQTENKLEDEIRKILEGN